MRQVLAVLFALFSCLATPSFAAKLVTDLSKDQIAIEANFTGDKILLFGAIDNAVQNAQVDVIVVVRGPAINALLRKKEYQAGIWLNGSEMTFGAMPSFYSIASNRPLDEIAPSKTLALHELGMQELKHFPTDTAFTQDELAEFAAAHIRLKKEQGLYRDDDTGVQIISGRLFRSEIKSLPKCLLENIRSTFSYLKMDVSPPPRPAHWPSTFMALRALFICSPMICHCFMG